MACLTYEFENVPCPILNIQGRNINELLAAFHSFEAPTGEPDGKVF